MEIESKQVIHSPPLVFLKYFLIDDSIGKYFLIEVECIIVRSDSSRPWISKPKAKVSTRSDVIQIWDFPHH